MANNYTNIPKEWLWYPGSLTRLMEQQSQMAIKVNVIREGMGPLFLSEKQFLQSKNHLWGWVREVQLVSGNTEWLRARTVIPLKTLKHRARRLKYIGTKPIGPILFERLGGIREYLDIRSVTKVDWLEEQAEPLWQRRSLFRIDEGPLMVSELFLPDNPVYGKHH